MKTQKRPLAALTAKGAVSYRKTTWQPARRWPSRQLSRDALDAAKARVGIPEAWRALGLPGEPRRACRSPLRDDRHASFSISADDRLWFDHGTGEGGDVVNFIAKALDCDTAAAIRRLREIAGGDMNGPAGVLAPPRKPKPFTPATQPKPLPDLTAPTFADVQALAELRGFPSFVAFEIAAARGLLRMAILPDRGETVRAWVLTDDARLTVQARRLDGHPWQRTGAKSDTLRLDSAHPIGLAALGKHPVVALVEGEPDALAALHFAFLAGIAGLVAPLCLTGAAKRIPEAVTGQLQGRQVRIFRQADAAGHSAALAWGEQLETAGVEVCAVSLDGLTRPDGVPAKDIADLARWPVETWASPEEVQADAAQAGNEGQTLGPVAPGWFNFWEGVKL